MADKTLADLAGKMRDIDFAMLATHTDGGAIGARPMSNNRDVDYDGDSYYFTSDDTRMVADIARDPQVVAELPRQLGPAPPAPLLRRGRGPAPISSATRPPSPRTGPATSTAGSSEGVDTPGLVMIHVRAEPRCIIGTARTKAKSASERR